MFGLYGQHLSLKTGQPLGSRLDPLTPEARSQLMAKVRSKGNESTEKTMARILRSERISGWRRHRSDLPGRPDFYFPAQRLAVFVHGCFWHGCPRCYRAPKSNRPFWQAKVSENRARDQRVTYQLRAMGIRTVTVWEHEVAGTVWIRRLRRRL